MVRAIIFDLDNCLAPANEVGEQLYEPAFEAMRRANHGGVPEGILAAAFADCWRIPLDEVGAMHGLSRETVDAGFEVFRQMEVQTAMRGYPDLAALGRLPVERHLVTAGFRRLQESKIRALGIAPLFASIHIDAIDGGDRKGKHSLFAGILATNRYSPGQVAVVGDSARSEIDAGNRLGLCTVQILRPGVPWAENAEHHIRTLGELVGLLSSADTVLEPRSTAGP